MRRRRSARARFRPGRARRVGPTGWATVSLVGLTVGSLLLVGGSDTGLRSSGESGPVREAPRLQATPVRPRAPRDAGDHGTAEPRPPRPVEARPAARPSTPDTPTQARAAAWLDELDGAERLGQLLMLRVYGGGIDEADPRNERLYGVATPREVLETLRPGGIILFRRDGEDTGNLRSPEQVRAFTDAMRDVVGEDGPPPLIAVDQEGGRVDRIGHFGTHYPAARALGGDRAAARAHARRTATELAALGIDLNFAPVADVDTEASNPVIGDRAPGDDPATVAAAVLAQLEGYDGSGVAPAVKHFPGHGDTTADSHHTLPVVEADLATLRERELVPFARAVEAGVPAVMTAHLELPAVTDGGGPVSLSEEVVTGLLRDELGFEGLIVSDSLEMAGVREGRPDEEVALRAFQAGHDLLVLPPAPRASARALAAAVEDGRIATDRLEASARRILELKATLAEQAEERPDPGVVGRSPGSAPSGE